MLKRRISGLRIAAISLVLTAVFIPTVAIAVWQVLHGRGGNTYSNVYGLAVHYTSVLVLLAVILAVLAISFIARIIYFWRSSHDSTALVRKIRKMQTPLK